MRCANWKTEKLKSWNAESPPQLPASRRLTPWQAAPCGVIFIYCLYPKWQHKSQGVNLLLAPTRRMARLQLLLAVRYGDADARLVPFMPWRSIGLACFAALLAFSLTLTNIFVRFNPISWWSCTIGTRAPSQALSLRLSFRFSLRPCLSLWLRLSSDQLRQFICRACRRRQQIRAPNDGKRLLSGSHFGLTWFIGSPGQYLRAFCRKLVAFGFC